MTSLKGNYILYREAEKKTLNGANPLAVSTNRFFSEKKDVECSEMKNMQKSFVTFLQEYQLNVTDWSVNYRCFFMPSLNGRSWGHGSLKILVAPRKYECQKKCPKDHSGGPMAIGPPYAIGEENK